MRIGIDARISYYNSSGLTRYLQGLVAALAALPDADEIICLQNWRQSLPLVRHPAVSVRKYFTPPHFRYEKLLLAIEARKEMLDVLHCVDFYAPFPDRQPLVFTAQDLYFMHDPKCMSADSFRHYSAFCEYAKHATHIVCSSISTQQDVLRFTGVPAEKTSVIYPGIPLHRSEFDRSQKQQLLQRYKLDSAPLLFVGTIEPRKNLQRLLKAYEIASERTTSELPVLVLVGRSGYRAEEFFNALERSPVWERVLYLSEVSDVELAGLYSIARIVLYPGLYEGFGFPILEGFAAGVPVITSSVSSMQEVAGDAALLVDPLSEEAIAQAILTLVTDEDLSAMLVEKGSQRLNDFSWQRAAGEVRALYNTLVMN